MIWHVFLLPGLWFVESFFFFFLIVKDQTAVFFAAARREGADREAAAKQLKIFLSCRVPVVNPMPYATSSVALFKKEEAGSPLP